VASNGLQVNFVHTLNSGKYRNVASNGLQVNFVHTLYSGKYRNVASNGLQVNFVHTLYSGKYRNVASNGLQVNLLLPNKVPNSPYQCPFQNYVIILYNLSILGQNNRRGLSETR